MLQYEALSDLAASGVRQRECTTLGDWGGSPSGETGPHTRVELRSGGILADINMELMHASLSAKKGRALKLILSVKNANPDPPSAPQP